MAEVDRLSLMVDVSSRAERLRITMRAVRQKTPGNKILTDKDLLDWLKFAQSETDGLKLDLAKLETAFNADEVPLATKRPAGREAIRTKPHERRVAAILEFRSRPNLILPLACGYLKLLDCLTRKSSSK